MAIGDWRLAIGDWRLAIGDWRLAICDLTSGNRFHLFYSHFFPNLPPSRFSDFSLSAFAITGGLFTP